MTKEVKAKPIHLTVSNVFEIFSHEELVALHALLQEGLKKVAEVRASGRPWKQIKLIKKAA